MAPRPGVIDLFPNIIDWSITVDFAKFEALYCSLNIVSSTEIL